MKNVPRGTNSINYVPRSKAQKLMLKRETENVFDVCLFGASGVGKTVALIISSIGPQADGTALIHRSEYRALFLRRESTLLNRSGLIDAAHMWYKRFDKGVVLNKVEKMFTFSSGATITFGGVEQESDKEKYKGYTELHCVLFEELTQFSQSIFDFIVSRLRTATDIPLRVRSSTNPGDREEAWVMNRYKYWITKSAEPLNKDIEAKWGQTLHYWANTDGISVGTEARDGSFSFCGIETYIDDMGVENAKFMSAQISDPLLRAQLVDGMWGLKAGAGQYFAVTDLVETFIRPNPAVRIRYWDSAASGPKGDYLAGALVSHTIEGVSKFCIEDIVLVKAEPGDVMDIIKKTAIKDGKSIYIGMEQEPASHSKILLDLYQKELRAAGFNVLVDTKKDSKLVRAQLVSPIAKQGRLSFIKVDSSEEMIKQLVSFPTKGVHDDAVDCVTGAIFFLVNKLPRPVMIPVLKKQGPAIDFKALMATASLNRR